MTSKATTVVYTGDTFKNLIRKYSNERMQRDEAYRADVEKEMQRRRDAKKAEESK
jgi:hypothetical protein